uniref:Uncharacterized protein n=1 Tax=Dechloromonas aromatica (strain RCB) TaxID=159087 RepID=Q47EE4_DECAR
MSRCLPVFQMSGKNSQSHKVEDCMENYSVRPASPLRQEDVIVSSEEEVEKENLFLDASTAAERLTKRAETTALAVIAAEAIVLMALSAVTAVAGKLDNAAQETLLVAKKAAEKTLQVAKDDAEETLALAKEVAKELLEDARRKSERHGSDST